MSENVAPPRKRRALRVVAGTNVVPLAKRAIGTHAIVNEVMAESQRRKAEISAMIRECSGIFEAQHRERANELLPIALKMKRSTLDDFIEIGLRLLVAGGSRS